MPTSTIDTTNEQPPTDVTTTTTATEPAPPVPTIPDVEIKEGDWVAVADQTVLGWDWHGNVKSLPTPTTAMILWNEFSFVELEYDRNALVVIAPPIGS